MSKVILVERYSPVSFFWENLLKWNRLTEFSVEEVIRKYQGFEGDLIFFLKDSNDFCSLEDIKEKYKRYENFEGRSLMCVSTEEAHSSFILEKTYLVGYDVGVCEEEKTLYSSIFNEIIFGNLNELITWKNFLNENLLFSDKKLAENYLSVHNVLSIQGKSVEDYEEMKIYEIRKFTENGF